MLLGPICPYSCYCTLVQYHQTKFHENLVSSLVDIGKSPFLYGKVPPSGTTHVIAQVKLILVYGKYTKSVLWKVKELFKTYQENGLLN